MLIRGDKRRKHNNMLYKEDDKYMNRQSERGEKMKE
jgi:hypothetical protein